MNRFVNFIFVLLISGILMALLIVYTFSQRSAVHQKAELVRDQGMVRAAMEQIQRQSRRGDMAVEWQRVSADGKILETAIVWQPHNVNQDKALPIQHFVIPGEQMAIDGVAFRFTEEFSPEAGYLRGSTICVLNNVYGFGPDQKPAGYFRLTPMYVAPMTLLVDPLHPTVLEKQLWGRIWKLYEDKDTKHLDPDGLEILAIPATTRVMERGKLYHVWIGKNLGNGASMGIDIDEDRDGTVQEILRRATAETRDTSRPE